MAPSKSTEREAREARERLRRYNARQAVHEKQISRRKRDNYWAIGVVVVVAAIAAVLQLFYFNGGPGTPTPVPTASETAPPAAGTNVGDVPDPSFVGGGIHTGEIVLNDTVTLGISLDADLAPQAVSSLAADSLSGYYVGKTCHRLVSTESAGLLQCGSLDGTAATDPTYSFGPIENAPADQLYPAGTIAMARASGDAYSNGRQFFIVVADTTLPDDAAGGYTIVGQVTSGLDQLIAQITAAGTVDGSADGAPLIATTISSFTIQ